MSIRLYLVLGFLAFLAATTGSDVFARMTIGGQSLGNALSEHFYWAGVQLIGTLMLLLPFGFLAVIGAWVEAKANRLKGVIVFGLPTLYLIYSCFEGYRASKIAELDHRWTAATLSVGFLSFAAVPIVLLAWLVGFVVVGLRRKDAEPHSSE